MEGADVVPDAVVELHRRWRRSQPACTDMVGQPIKELSTATNEHSRCGGPGHGGRLHRARQGDHRGPARTPVQCDFKPLLDKNTPASLCGAGSPRTPSTGGLRGRVWPAGRLASSQVAFPGGRPPPWQVSTHRSGQPPGVAWPTVRLRRGPCDGSCRDFSSVDSPRARPSRSRRRPAQPAGSPSTTTWRPRDGRRRQREDQLNGGAYHASRRRRTSSTSRPPSCHGRAGQHQPDAGPGRASPAPTVARPEVRGAPRIDLSAPAGVAGGTIKLRFDVGRDGCGGVDGWYVDNIKVTVCKADPRRSPPRTRRAGRPWVRRAR